MKTGWPRAVVTPEAAGLARHLRGSPTNGPDWLPS